MTTIFKCISLTAVWASLLTGNVAFGQSRYTAPSPEILQVLRAPATPAPSVSPDKTTLLLLRPDRYPPIAELAQPMYRLAGTRLNPKNFGPRLPFIATSLEVVDLTKPAAGPTAIATGALKLGLPEWNGGGTMAAFPVYGETSVDVAVWRKGTTKLELLGVKLNAVNGGAMEWMPDGKRLLLHLVPAGLGAPPAAPSVPAGPEIQESLGKAAPAPTFQDLLQSDHDELLFDYYFTKQIAIYDLASRKMQPVGKAAIYDEVSVNPAGDHLLVARITKPYSRTLPMGRFPVEMEVWSTAGKMVKQFAQLPLAERIPLEGVRTGPRNVNWKQNEPATLLWVEALDGGNPKETVPHRDRVMASSAPFQESKELARLENRSMGIRTMSDGSLLLGDLDRKTRKLRTMILDGGKMVSFHERNMQDRYRDLGVPLTETQANGRRVIPVNNGTVLFAGDGASPKGDQPFLDAIPLANKTAKRRLFQSEEGYYETVVSALSPDGSRLLLRRESTTEPPNYYLWQNGQRTALTKYPDPAPALRKVTKKLVTYKRADGLPLSFTLYLPPGYKEGTRLPTVVWAYPYDYNDADAASQISGSPHRFTSIGGASHLFFLLAGYAILDNASLPVVGDAETFNNTYMEQIVAGAKAAIEKATELGVTDPNRVGVGGHSYGAFMTANLLAHSDLFAAGIARSGAYNRTLTPFGFQTERRTFWEAPETYLKMSPFMNAHKINEPILLIHGMADNNTGTFPIQSERMYTAVKGNGGTVKLVMLPHESHGYAARESTEHVVAEMIQWFDKHVKNRMQP